MTVGLAVGMIRRIGGEWGGLSLMEDINCALNAAMLHCLEEMTCVARADHARYCTSAWLLVGVSAEGWPTLPDLLMLLDTQH